MFSTFLLLALLQREPKDVGIIQIEKSSTESAGRTSQLVPHHERTISRERPHKGYHLSLLRVATGAYKTYNSTSQATRDTSIHTSNASTLCSDHVGELNQLIDNKIADAIPQDHILTASVLQEAMELLKPFQSVTPPLLVHQEYLPNVHVSHEDHVDHPIQAQPVLDEFEAQLLPEQYVDGVNHFASQETDIATYSLIQPIPTRSFNCNGIPDVVPDWVNAFLDESKLPQHLVALEQSEEGFQALYEELEPTPASLNNWRHFGIAFNPGDDLDQAVIDFIDDQQGVPFDLPLYRAIWAAKLDLEIDEFDPNSFINGRIEPNTYEADAMEDLPQELRTGFLVYLEHLARLQAFTKPKPWKPQERAVRSDAEFHDNVFLENLLRRQEPSGFVPDGRNGMIDEYWYRQGLDSNLMKLNYWNTNRTHAEIRDHYWLSDDSERRLNPHQYHRYQPADPSHNCEIEDLEQLHVAKVDCHPCHIIQTAVTRIYESWEPKKLFGEETFPICMEGFEAYNCLKEYEQQPARSVWEWQIEEQEKEWQIDEQEDEWQRS